MTKIAKILLLYFVFVASNTLLAQDVVCKLKGTIVNRSSDTILLLRETDDIRYEDGIKIPIHNNNFDSDLKVPCTEKFLLIFQENRDAGRYKRIYFFPENCTVNFTLHSNDSMKMDVVSGGGLNLEMFAFNNKVDSIFVPQYNPYRVALDSLMRNKKFYSNKGLDWLSRIGNTNDEIELGKLYKEEELLKDKGEFYSSEAYEQLNNRDSIYRLKYKWTIEYIRTHIDVFSYSLLLQSLDYYLNYDHKFDLNLITDTYPIYSDKFPDHPYTIMMGSLLHSISSIKIGGHYIDFTAPTPDGKMVKVSEVINGKVALLDFWASWCGSCRTLSKSVIPVYEKYKDRGFTVVGVAGEYKNTDAFIAAVAKDNYPWLNLIELDHQSDLWNKYNIGKQGGNTFLVDSKGTIIAIHPTAEELDGILGSLLGEKRE
jgi:thiol-disulfide isomerase/thioredoxin